jgi:hypothetical protein
MKQDDYVTVVGIAEIDGGYKLRWSNSLKVCLKRLTRQESKDIRMIEIGEELSKFEAAVWLRDHADYQDFEAQYIILEYLDKQIAKPIKEKVAKQVSDKPKAVKASGMAKGDSDALAQAIASLQEEMA